MAPECWIAAPAEAPPLRLRLRQACGRLRRVGKGRGHGRQGERGVGLGREKGKGQEAKGESGQGREGALEGGGGGGRRLGTREDKRGTLGASTREREWQERGGEGQRRGERGEECNYDCKMEDRLRVRQKKANGTTDCRNYKRICIEQHVKDAECLTGNCCIYDHNTGPYRSGYKGLIQQ